MHWFRTTRVPSIWRQRLFVAALLIAALLPRAVALDAMISTGSIATGFALVAPDGDRTDLSDLGIAGFQPVICHTDVEPGSGSDHAHHRDGDCCSTACCIAFPVPSQATGLPSVALVPIVRLTHQRQTLVIASITARGFQARAPPILIST